MKSTLRHSLVFAACIVFALIPAILLGFALADNSGTSASAGSDQSKSPAPAMKLVWHSLGSATSAGAARLLPIQQTNYEFSAQVVVPGLFVGSVASKQGTRGVIEIPDGALTSEIGKPRLPVLRYMIEITAGAHVNATLESASSRLLSLQTLGIEHPLLPVQLPVPKIEDAEKEIPFIEDAALYSRDAFYPEEAVRVVGEAMLRGRHVVLIEVRPVLYNPMQGILEIRNEGVLHIQWSGGDQHAGMTEKLRVRSVSLDSWIKGQIDNPDLSDQIAPSAPAGASENATMGSGGGAAEGAEGLLIIVNDSFYDSIQPLAEWKEKSGYKVEVIKTSSLGNPPTDVNIKSAIQSRYDTWSNPSLGFVLLVGDTDYCPIHWGNGGGLSQVTDNWYACTSGTDYLPDLAIARISTRTSAETSNVIDKIMLYEKATFATETWAKKAGFIGTSDYSHYTMIENTHDYCIDNYMTPNSYLQTTWSHGKESCDRHYYTYNSTTSEIAASIDEGRSIVNYSGHGSTYSWQGPTSNGGYGQNDVRSNTNDGMYPFVISNACVTGSLQATECFGETWQKEPHKGAIAFWGASNNSYWNEDDYLQRRLYANIFPMDSTPPIGIIVNETKIDLYGYYGNTGTVAYYFDMYNILCEPTLSLWTREPRTLSVSSPESIPIGQSSFDVSVAFEGSPVANALVAVRRIDDGVFESAYTDAAGNVSFTLDPAPATPGLMEVTVTKHDFRPHEGTCNIISPDGPWLTYRSHQVDESAGGDGDGKVSPNETIIVPVTVENIGQMMGTGLSGTLAANTPSWVDILDGSASFPDLAGSEQGTTLPDHFKIYVKTTAHDGASMGFDLYWTASDSSSGTTSFNQQVTAPDFSFESYSIDDSFGGSSGGTAGPGETVDMTVTVSNVGHEDAETVHGILSTNSPYITILQDESAFQDIPIGGQGSSLAPQFRFLVADNAPEGQPVTFHLSIMENGSFHSELLTFDVMISSCDVPGSQDVPKSINDNSTVDSLLSYPDVVTINEVNVFVDIKHTYIGDLKVTLIAPSGTTVILHNNSGGTTDNIITWYDTLTTPYESLSKLNGENAQGTWILRVQDTASSDTGTLEAWKLEICGQTVIAAPFLSVIGHEMDDTGTCNPDGYADVGEIVTYRVTIQNTGSAQATGVNASVSSGSRLEGLNNPVALPDLNPGESAVADFDVLIGAVGCVEDAALNVIASSNEGSWGSSFSELLEVDDTIVSVAENLEHGGAEPDGWTHAAFEGTDDWGMNTARNHTTGGGYSWFTSNSNKLKDVVLITPSYDILIGGSATMEFYHWVSLQDGFDGGVLEMSADGGNTWSDMGAFFTEGGYDATLSYLGPLANRQAWTGKYSNWKRTVVDLTSWAGKTVKLRFRLGCDGSRKVTGWWIDDISLTTSGRSCDTHPCGLPGEVHGVMLSKSGDDIIVSWSENVLAEEYRIYRGSNPASLGSFSDATAEDSNMTDTIFLERSDLNISYFIITAVGPDGEGPWEHYSQ